MAFKKCKCGNVSALNGKCVGCYFRHACGGTFKPIPTWSGRYRCDKCRVIGYRSMVRADTSTGPLGSHIVVYICSVHRCERGAVSGSPKKRKARCSEHSK